MVNPTRRDAPPAAGTAPASRSVRTAVLVMYGLLGVIALGFLYSAVSSGVDGGELAAGLVPSFAGTESVLLATGILGATVMPHVIYLHSALTQDRIPAVDDDEVGQLLRHQRVDVVVAMGLAGLVNMAMLVLAARLFAGSELPGLDTLEGAYVALGDLAGQPVALAFALALLASGFASSGVGTYAGQVVMQGFLQRRIPLVVRRLVTLAPALVIIAAGVDTTAALVISQVRPQPAATRAKASTAQRVMRRPAASPSPGGRTPRGSSTGRWWW